MNHHRSTLAIIVVNMDPMIMIMTILSRSLNHPYLDRSAALLPLVDQEDQAFTTFSDSLYSRRHGYVDTAQP